MFVTVGETSSKCNFIYKASVTVSIFFWLNNSKRLTWMIGKIMALFRYKMCNYLTLMEDLSCGHCHMIALFRCVQAWSWSLSEWWNRFREPKRPATKGLSCRMKSVDVSGLTFTCSCCCLQVKWGRINRKGKKLKPSFRSQTNTWSTKTRQSRSQQRWNMYVLFLLCHPFFFTLMNWLSWQL